MSKVLIADDEKPMREIISDYLNSHGFETVTAADGEEAVARFYENPCDLVLLDVMMPRLDGIAACRELRRFSDVPVIFLSALGEEEDFLRAYGVGADDYVTKPFSLAVLQRKVQAVIARYRGLDGDNRLSAGGIVLDPAAMKVTVDGRTAEITGLDLKLLELLMQNKGRVLTRDQLLSRVWGYDYEGDPRVLDTHIRRLRRLLGARSGCIRTKINTGYLFEEEAE